MRLLPASQFGEQQRNLLLKNMASSARSRVSRQLVVMAWTGHAAQHCRHRFGRIGGLAGVHWCGCPYQRDGFDQQDELCRLPRTVRLKAATPSTSRKPVAGRNEHGSKARRTQGLKSSR